MTGIRDSQIKIEENNENLQLEVDKLNMELKLRK